MGSLPPTILHLLIKKCGGDVTKELLPLVQLMTNITKPLGIGKSHFYKAMGQLGPHKKKAAPPNVVATLKRIGGISHTSPKCELVTMTTACKLLTKLNVPKLVVDSLLTKVCASDLLSDSESPSDEGDTSSDEGDDSDDDVVVQEDEEKEAELLEEEASEEWDDLIHVEEPDVVSKPPRYGLTSIKGKQERQACLSTIKLEMEDFQKWSQALYQPGRPSDLLQQSFKTWESQQKRVYEYLGYLYHYKDVSRPTLNHYMDTDYLLDFLEFLKGRGVDKAGHTKAVHAAVRAVSYIKSLPTTDQRKAKAAIKSLKDLGTQLGQNMVPKPKSKEPEELKEAGKWMDAPELMARVEKVRTNALEEVDEMKAGKLPRLHVAKTVHNALFATMCFGYMPPLRHNSVLLTLTAPPHLGCIHPDCQHKLAGCQGNRVHRHPTSGRWWLDVPHHKNTKAWGGSSLKFELPNEVAQLLEHHVTWAHSTLVGHTEQYAPNIFINTTTGMPLKDQEISQLWSKTVLEGTGIHFGPQVCRSIFVSGTRDAALPNPPGMAMIMGNSQAVWDSVYDRHFNTREAHAALDLMPRWRQQMLAKAKGPPTAAE
jgi:hypothetical protein